MKIKILAILFVLATVGLLSLSKTDYTNAQSFAEKTTPIETLTVGGTTTKYHKFGGKYNNVFLMVYDTADASSRLDSIFVGAFYPQFNTFGNLLLTDLASGVNVFATGRNGRPTTYRLNHTVGIDSVRVLFFNGAPTGRKVYYYFRLFNTY